MLAFGLLGTWLMAGCASLSPFNQEFVEIRTTHFHVMSSFGVAETQELARVLEFYHAGTLKALELGNESRGIEMTRVLAFDDRSLGRPFGVRGEDAFFLPTPESGIIVLRTSADWRQRATLELRLRYAHRLLRNLAAVRYPLWLEEGLAQFASTVDVRGREISIGAPIEQHTSVIRDWSRGSLSRLLKETDLTDYNPSAREDFDARSWALVHVLKSAGRGARTRSKGLQRYTQQLERGVSGAQAIDALGEDPETLADQISEYVEKDRFRVERVLLEGWDPGGLELVPVSWARARVELAELALVLERLELAEEYFERALDAEPGNPRALVGLARTRVDGFERAEELTRLALGEAGTADPSVLVRAGEFYAAGARQASLDESERLRRLEQARRLFLQSLRIEERGVEARLGLARTYLEEGEDAREGIRWVESARRLRPGSLDVELVSARLLVKQDLRGSARRRASDVVSRARSARLRKQGRELLDAERE